MGQHAGSAGSGGQLFLARAPILTRRHRVLGYQIRVGQRTGSRLGPDADTDVSHLARVIDSVGIDTLTHGHAAFIKVNRRNLLDGSVKDLRATDVVLELDASLDADGPVRTACTALRAQGYRMAIDDFTVTSPAAGLASTADYLKIDLSDPRSAETRARTVACFHNGVTQLVAKGVETIEQVEAASQDGFVCFQGYYFGRPVFLPGRQISPAQVTLLRLLRALNDQNLSLGQLEDLVKHDAALCYRLLRAVNSAAAGRRQTVSSIRDALLLLGRDTVRRWASLWAVAGMNVGAHSELVVMSTVRARLCELLAGSTRGEEAAGEAFLLGMCSLLDAILGRPMAAIAEELPLGDETRRALCGAVSPARDLLDCVIAYERGDWAACESIATRARVNSAVLPGAFLEALRWSREFQDPQEPPSRPS